jgi:hypothetical protein
MTDEQLCAGFRAASLPDDAFHHEQHVRVAWNYVREFGLPGALGEFSVALKRFAVAKGAPHLYHATITWAFLLLIGERLARGSADTWSEFAQENPDLLRWKPSLLDDYYNTATLWSDIARRTFVFPDKRP